MRKLALIVLFLVLTASCCLSRNVYLVSAGISDYPGTEKDLRLPANDARAMYRLYLRNSKAETVLLTNRKATRSNILSNARNLFSRAGKDDIVVFFFSGHGFSGGFCTYDDYLSYDEVRKLFASCKAGNKMIFADACFSGDIRVNRSGKNDPDNNIMLFLSSRNKELSMERTGMRNGIFTACLLRCLKGGADVNQDRVITARELFDAVSKGVKDLSRDRQHPVMWGNFNDNMPVMIW